jgi:tetratricopeptide (TPR) repeat protein
MGRCYENLGKLDEAERAYHQACGEASNTREPWAALSLLMYMQCRWEESFAFAMRGLKIKDRELVYTCDPAVWGYQLHDLASIAAWHLGIKDIALEQAKLALEKEPADQRLRNNLTFIEDAISDKVEEAA